MRNEPWLLVFVIPVLAMTLAIALTAIMMWLVVAVAVLALGGHPKHPRQRITRAHAPGLRPRGVHGLARSSWRWI